MAIEVSDIHAVKIEIDRLVKAMDRIYPTGSRFKDWMDDPRGHGALRRASLDLSEALLKMRRH